MAQQILSTNTFTTAKWIVSATASDGTHTTIAAALTSASSGDTIFIRPGTYTENLTLKAGVDLTAFGSDSSLNGTGKVIISGTCTFSAAGAVTISGIQLQTNSAALLAVTGSAASIVNLQNCYLNCTNNTGITFSSSNAGAIINIYRCKGDFGTTGIALFSQSSAGTLNIYFSVFQNSNSTLTASTVSAGQCNVFLSILNTNFTSSSTGGIGFFQSQIDVQGFNITALTAGGSGSHLLIKSSFFSGTASAISISQTVTMLECCIGSSNTNAVTGAGTLIYSGTTFQSSSSTINVTTQTGGTLIGGKFQAPSAGFLGERISSFVTSASAVTLTNNTAANITSISLTAGVWDIGALMCYQNAAITGTQFEININTTSATRGTQGDSNSSTPNAPTAASIQGLSIPSYRLTLTSTTTVYLVAYALFSVGTLKAFGRISATRVG